MQLTTILFLRRDNQLLLAMKKRGFGVGKWNGVGGKVDPGETIEQAAIREAQEEIGVTPLNPKLMGKLRFFMPNDPSFEYYCHVYVTDTWQGEPVETEEMRPQWFGLDAIPYDEMWADDYLWLPLLLEGKLFEGRVVVDEQTVTEHDIRIADSLTPADQAPENLPPFS